MVTAGEIRAALTARSLPALQQASAAARPDHLAFDVEGERITHGELAGRTAGTARWLVGRGIGPGVRVLLCGSPSVPYVSAYLSLLAAGVTVVPASPALTVAELRHVAGDAGTRVALAGGSGIAAVRELAESDGQLEVLRYDGEGPEPLVDVQPGAHGPCAPEPAAPALVAYTSGTTGRPRGAILSHANIAASILAAMWSWRWTPDEVLVHALPLSHQHGLSGVHATVAGGSTAVLRARFEPERLVSTLRRHRASVLFAVPAMYDRLVAIDPPGPLPALRLPVSGSAPLSESRAEQVREWLGQAPLERYGTTESGLNLSNLYGTRRRGRVGWPLPGLEVELRDPGGRTIVQEGIDGEICVRGPQVFCGYLGDRQATEGAFWPAGWFRTGDVGAIDTDGSVAVVGRRKDLIISGGYNVYPREVEVVLETHPDVGEVAVVGVPDARWGEAVTAYVVPVAGTHPSLDALAAHARTRLAAFKCPKRVVMVNRLPRNALGKVRRDLLAARPPEVPRPTPEGEGP